MPLTKDTKVDSFMAKASQPPVMENEESFDALLADARQAKDHGDMEGATMRYRDAMLRNPGALEPIHELAVVLDRQGQSEESAKLYAKALHLAPRNAELLTDYAYSRYLQSDLESAKELLQRALEVNPRFERAHNNLALVLTREGQDDAAAAAFENGGLTHSEALDNVRQAKRAAELSRSSLTR